MISVLRGQSRYRPSTSVSTTSRSAPQRDGQRGGGGVGVDVVHHAVQVGGDAGHHRHPAGGDQALDRLGVHRDHVADQAEVDLLAVDHGAAPLGGEQAAVLAGHADRQRAVPVDQPDQLATDLADQHHPDDLHGLRAGHPQAAAELRGDAEPLQHRRRSAVRRRAPRPGARRSAS